MLKDTHQNKFLFSAKNLVGFFFIVCFLLTFAPNKSFADSNPRYASIVIDADTGMVLHERYADKKLHPASLTKIMTLLMVFEAMDQGKITLNTRVQISRHAASMVPSKLGLKPGSSIKVKDAISILVTKSANDIAVALAEHLGRNESSFADLMTRKAHHIGMQSTTFRNASGLHDSKQVTTARDMALLAQYVINNYPTYYKYFSQESYNYQGSTYKNHNKLLGKYKGMDGMKTGYVTASGFNLVASAVRNNRRIIGVVFGGRTGTSRNDHMVELLDAGFTKMNDIRVAHAQVPLPPRKPASLSGTGMQVAQDETFEDNPKLASMGALIGEGDYDVDKIRRVETGMMAIAAHTGRTIEMPQIPTTSTQNGLAINAAKMQDWSIQIGAFSNRAATDKLLHDSLTRLPPTTFSSARAVVAPLKTQDGWLFRGRLTGLNKNQALAACSYFKECMPIAPPNH